MLCGDGSSLVSKLFQGMYGPWEHLEDENQRVGERFWALLLPVPPNPADAQARTPTLYDCLRLSGLGTTAARTAVEAETPPISSNMKRRGLAVLPPYLVIQFKPAAAVSSGAGGTLVPQGRRVSFPSEGLDMAPYAATVTATVLYTLVAVIYYHRPNEEHEQGHYTAAVTWEGGWWLCDDTVCREISAPGAEPPGGGASNDKDHVQHVLVYHRAQRGANERGKLKRQYTGKLPHQPTSLKQRVHIRF